MSLSSLSTRELPHGEVLFTESEVNRAIDELAELTVATYGADEQKPLFVALLRGAMPFAAQLMRSIVQVDPNFHPELDDMTISTYGAGREAQTPEVVMDIDTRRTDVAGRRIVLLDDMIDKGVTAAFAARLFGERGAKTVDIAALCAKQTLRDPSFDEFPGEEVSCFEVPDVWITGMGMDDSRVAPEGNRWLPYIAVAREL